MSFPARDEFLRAYMNPPVFTGDVSQAGNENSRVTIRHPVTGADVRAIAFGGNILGGKVPVFALEGGGYMAVAPTTRTGERRSLSLPFQSQQSPEIPVPVESGGAYVVHFFATVLYDRTMLTPDDDGRYAYGSNDGAWQYWLYLIDGTNVLQVLATDPYEHLNTSSASVIDINDEYALADVTNLWVLDRSTFIFQCLTGDYSGAEARRSLHTLLIRDWAIAQSDFQSGLEAGQPLSYPTEFDPYIDYLVERINTIDVDEIRDPPIAIAARSTHPFMYERGDTGTTDYRKHYNLPSDGIPTRVEWFPQGFAEEDSFAEDEPINEIEMLDAHLFDRSWRVNQNDENEADFASPVIPFDQMSTSHTTFFDSTYILWADGDSEIASPISSFRDGTSPREALRDLGIMATAPTNSLNAPLHNYLHWYFSRGIVG